MEFQDIKESKRGSIALLCFNDTPEELLASWNGIKVGTHGTPLDFKVRPGMGVVDTGYREKEITDKHSIRDEEDIGIVKRELKLQRFLYLHSDRDHHLIIGRINPSAPVMSCAHQVGATEIHTQKIEDQKFSDALVAVGVKVVLLKADGTPVVEPEKPVEAIKEPEKTPTVINPKTGERVKRGGRKKGTKNKPKPASKKAVRKFKKALKELN